MLIGLNVKKRNFFGMFVGKVEVSWVCAWQRSGDSISLCFLRVISLSIGFSCLVFISDLLDRVFFFHLIVFILSTLAVATRNTTVIVIVTITTALLLLL